MAKIKQYILCFFLLICCCAMQSTAQTACRLVIQTADSSTATITALQLNTRFNSKAACLTYVQKLPDLLTTKGYISNSIDAVKEDSTNVYVTLFTGRKYIWEQLIVSQQDWSVLNQLGYSSNAFNNKPFDQQKVTVAYTKLLDYYSNNGYPFAQLSLDSITIKEDLITAKLNIDKGILYRIDTILIKGDAKISKEYLIRYLGLEEGSMYQQEILDRIDSRITELPFIVQSQPRSITMLNTGAEVNLFLQNRKSNQVNVLVGFLPSNLQLGGKLLVTGEANLNLRNPFGYGETLGINWQQLQSKSPRLNLLFQRPYLFQTPVGVSMNFELYKRDSLFLNIHGLFGAQYNVSTRKSVTVALQVYKTNLLSVDTATIKATKRLPNMIDLNSTTLSFQYDYNNTNYRFNPRKGNELQFVVGFGQKNIKPNNSILSIKDPSFDYASLYDTVQQKAYIFRSSVNAAHYFPVGRQATFKTVLQGGWLQSPNYYENELFQIGGFKKLRGFDEESIYTNRFLIATLEYRYLLAQNSWLFAFTDFGGAAYTSNSGSYTHNYIGFGAGLAFETNTGIFNISWALGKRNDLKLDLRQSKIHIGFVSLF
jgi:outer membrane protein assembly factor BamA